MNPRLSFPARKRSLKKEIQHYSKHDFKNGVRPQIDLMLLSWN